MREIFIRDPCNQCRRFLWNLLPPRKSVTERKWKKATEIKHLVIRTPIAGAVLLLCAQTFRETRFFNRNYLILLNVGIFVIRMLTSEWKN